MSKTVKTILSGANYRLLTALCCAVMCAFAQNGAGDNSIVQKIQREVAAGAQPASPGALRGEVLRGQISNPPAYPGTENDFQVYVPAEYDPAHPACLLLKLDGIGPYEAWVIDGLIASHKIPITIAVGISPGAVWRDPAGTPNRRAYRYDRSYEFDSTNPRFADFVFSQLLPAVQRMKTESGKPIVLSAEGRDHAVMGGSTGGIGSFTLAWQRPDQFTRVYSEIGTFVSMRGGNDYPALIRKTEPKTIRIFLEDGSADAWNPLFGSWFDANLNMESALSFAGYDVAHAWGKHGHDGRPGQAVLPDVLQWLWRDYPAPISAAAESKNSTLQEITLPGETWQLISHDFNSAHSLGADRAGNVFVAEASSLDRLDASGAFNVLVSGLHASAAVIGPGDVLYALDSAKQALVAIHPHGGPERIVAQGIAGHGITVGPDGALFVSEPGAHTDMPSRIWRISTSGKKTVIDEGLHSASGVTFSPDRDLFYAAENSTQWIYSFVVKPGVQFADKQAFDWLHITDAPNNSGAEQLAVDRHGNLYAATRMGIQICDENGRVRAILPLPSPSSPVVGIAFGGPNFDILYATDGKRVYKRRMKVPGLPPWADAITVPGIGAG